MVRLTKIIKYDPPYKQTERENTMFISLDAEKATPSWEKALERLEINITKAVYSQAIATIKWNDKQLKSTPWKSGTRQGCPLSLYLFSILEILTRAVRWPKEIQRVQIGKKSQGMIISRWYGSMHKWPSTSPREFLQLINTFSRVTRLTHN